MKGISAMALFLAGILCCLGGTRLEAQSSITPTVSRARQPQTLALTSSPTDGIDYHGGPTMVNPHNVYYIWYGSWTGNSALTILPSLVLGLNGSPYFTINTGYANNAPLNITNSASMSSQIFDSYSQGSLLSDSGLQTVVSSAIGRGALPLDSNGVYFVLSSADVDQIGSHGEYCNNFCGFHHHASMFGADIKFAFVGNADRCISQCAVMNFSVSPNNNPGADVMASVIAHEFSETVTDPDLNAWFDSSGQENADKCAYTYGSTFNTGNGAFANVNLGGLSFLIQQNWVNDRGGYCGMSTTGNPLSYASPRDQQLACYGISVAPNFPTNCTDIVNTNDKQMCFGLSQRSQSSCSSITDRNLRLACFGMSVSPSFPSNCRDITDPQMQNFCYGVASGGSMSNCNNLTDSNSQALCFGMSLHNAAFCSGITNTNDRLFCQGVSSGSQTPCTSIQ